MILKVIVILNAFICFLLSSSNVVDASIEPSSYYSPKKTRHHASLLLLCQGDTGAIQPPIVSVNQKKKRVNCYETNLPLICNESKTLLLDPGFVSYRRAGQF
jgi:hypothetical protein